MKDGELLPPGLYEQLLTEALVKRLPEERWEASDLADDRYSVLTNYVARVLDRALKAPGMDNAKRAVLCNRLLDAVAADGPSGAVLDGDHLPEPPELLTAIRPATSTLAAPMSLMRPETPLSEDALFVNAPHEPGLATELRHEIQSADRIELLCAFVRWTGIRTVLDELRRIRERGVPVRVITTVYTGSTEPRALDALAEIGAEVKISYDTRSTRLHAKAWLFERDSGFSTAYIGSSNLTHSALHEGLEWNVRLSEVRSHDLLDRFRAAFETYWSDEHFVPYRHDEFAEAVQRERTSTSIDFTPFDIIPFPYQRAMLDALRVERERHDRWRNLVVAATGTGKTVVAALDYRRMAEEWRGASLLFVAHRDEILRQSVQIFRHVLRDGSFGELLVSGERPTEGKHVFASVQSLARIDLQTVPSTAYDMVIVDEFHHAEASTYRRLLEHLRPRLLVGLTATPERADEKDILQWFDGTIAVDLRLWDALDQGLLCPFQYFGVADGVDLSQVEWKRKSYDTASLSGLYTGNDFRTAKVLGAVQEFVADPLSMRALGFCVSVEHAEYMARKFREAGIPSAAVTGNTQPAERRQLVGQLRRRELNTIFTVDVFNEGIDIPEVDTVLLLRPTESATIFLQQLGRGLRLSEGKSGLTVLDFIGQHRREFRFDARLQALTGIPARRLERAVQDGFPYLPSGCYIHLDRVATGIVLENIKAAVQYRRAILVRELRDLGDVSLSQFLRSTERTLDEIYKGTHPGWMSLRREAGLPAPPPVEDDDRLVRAVARMLHLNDDERLDTYRLWLWDDTPPDIGRLSPRELRLLTMLHLSLWGRNNAPSPLSESVETLWRHPAVRAELAEVLSVLAEQSGGYVIPDQANLEPLAIHARYTKDEVLAALGDATVERPPTIREGVRWANDADADVFFVTLRKSEDTFSPTTMYRDYAISPTLFHWESQSTTSAASPTGQRYINHEHRGSRVLLFVRETTGAYLYLGPAHYVQHSGDRPISFVWRLEHEIPPLFFLDARAAG